jgi:NADPH2:quinone reductase
VRAIQITQETGPESALAIVEIDEPQDDGGGVVVEVHAAGVSFPEVLQSRGQYQFRPPLPFVPGSEVGGVVRSAPPGSGFAPRDRVAAFTMLGAFAETAVAQPHFVTKVPDTWTFAQGAALILNYHTAYFSLVTRGRLTAGETVAVHGAAGGVGTATLQVAKGLGAQTVAVVSTDAKAEVARRAGADHVVRSTGPWKDEIRALGGVDVFIDPVGGERFTDTLRSLKPGGRAVVVGFTEGSIPEVRVNRLLLANTEVVGAGWGAHVLGDPPAARRIGAAVEGLIAAGHIDPIVGASFPLERAAEALQLIDGRGATGKVVLEVRAA